eukprot:9340012-Prorocentrum_lima.AAC.1
MEHECGKEFKIRLCSDSSSAKEILSRSGAGKIRHLERPLLWIQQVVQGKQSDVVKVAGVSSPVDI